MITFLVQERLRPHATKADQRIASSSLHVCKAAINALWKQQHLRGLNSNPDPANDIHMQGERRIGVSPATWSDHCASARIRQKLANSCR